MLRSENVDMAESKDRFEQAASAETAVWSLEGAASFWVEFTSWWVQSKETAERHGRRSCITARQETWVLCKVKPFPAKKERNFTVEFIYTHAGVHTEQNAHATFIYSRCTKTSVRVTEWPVVSSQEFQQKQINVQVYQQSSKGCQLSPQLKCRNLMLGEPFLISKNVNLTTCERLGTPKC